MTYEPERIRDECWTVEVTEEEDGQPVILAVDFSGPRAEERAREYCDWKNALEIYSSRKKKRKAVDNATEPA